MSYYRIYEYPMKEVAYKHIYFKGDRGRAGENTKKILDSLEQDEKYLNNLARTRRTIRDLALCNQFDYFCTFTFDGQKIDRYNFDVCRNRITKVFNNYKVRYSPDFRYLIVPEYHKDKAIHFHGLVRGIRPEDLIVSEFVMKREGDQLFEVPNTKGYVDWQYYSSKCGWFNCSMIRNHEKCASYIAKYVTKDLVSMGKGKRVLMASKGLRRPELVFDMDDVPMEFNPQYQDDFCSMAYLNEAFTVGNYLEPWYNECCSDLNDFGDPEDTFIPLTFEQLKLREVMESM